MEPGWFQVGSTSLPFVVRDVSLESDDPPTAAALDALAGGDILLRLRGDYYPTGEGQGRLVVSQFEQVSRPYTADTPLDATHRDETHGLAFDYPAGWWVEEGDPGGPFWLSLTNAPPGSHLLRPGREFHDLSLVQLYFRFEEMAAAADFIRYREELLGISSASPDYPFTVVVHETDHGPLTAVAFNGETDFLLPWSGRQLQLHSPLTANGDAAFVARLGNTLR